MNKNKKSSRQVKKNMLHYESKQTANIANATVAELVDALDSKSSGIKAMWVRVPPQAPNMYIGLTNWLVF